MCIHSQVENKGIVLWNVEIRIGRNGVRAEGGKRIIGGKVEEPRLASMSM
jgi:hypothetical protein